MRWVVYDFDVLGRYWLILVFIEVVDPAPMTAEDREIPPSELMYDACISMAGEHAMQARSNNMRIIQVSVSFDSCG